MGEGVRHLVPQSAKEAHSRRGEATKGLEEKRNDGVALAEGISVVGRRGGDVAGVLARVESPLALESALTCPDWFVSGLNLDLTWTLRLTIF